MRCSVVGAFDSQGKVAATSAMGGVFKLWQHARFSKRGGMMEVLPCRADLALPHADLAERHETDQRHHNFKACHWSSVQLSRDISCCGDTCVGRNA